MDATRWYNLGKEKFSQQSYSEAVELFQNAIQFDPDQMKIYQDLALAFIHQGKFSEALDVLDRYLNKKQDLSVELQRAGLLLILEEAEKAEEAFQAVLDQDPHNKDAKKGLGDSYFRQNNFKQAQKIYDQLLDESPNDAFLWFSKAEALYRAQDHETALDAIEKAIQIEAAPEFFAFKGDFFIRHDNYERALEQYRLASNLDPKSSEIQLRIGFIYRILDHPHDALDAFNTALELDAYLSEALQNKMEILHDLNRTNEANSVHEQLVRLQPENLKQAMILVHRYMDNQQYDRSSKVLEILLNHHHDNSEIWYALAYSMYQLNQSQRALQAIKKTIELEGEQDEYMELKEKVLQLDNTDD